MAKLFELAKNVETRKVIAVLSYTTRQQGSYARRLQSLEHQKDVAEKCKMCRPKKRVHNTLYKEQAGTCGTTTFTKRWRNSKITNVCRSNGNSYADSSILASRSNAAENRKRLGI